MQDFRSEIIRDLRWSFFGPDYTDSAEEKQLFEMMGSRNSDPGGIYITGILSPMLVRLPHLSQPPELIMHEQSTAPRFSWKGFYDFASSEDSAQRAFPSARSHHVLPSLLLLCGCRNINLLSIGCPYRVHLRIRLNLIRLTLIRNPWSFGEDVFHILNRYLCLHFLFSTLQRSLRIAFAADENAPLP